MRVHNYMQGTLTTACYTPGIRAKIRTHMHGKLQLCLQAACEVHAYRSIQRLFAVWLWTAQELQTSFPDMQLTVLLHALLAVCVPTLQAGLNTGAARKLLKADATGPCALLESKQLLSSIKLQDVHHELHRPRILVILL